MITDVNSSSRIHPYHTNRTFNVWGIPDWSVVSRNWTLVWLGYVYIFCIIYLLILGFGLVVFAKYHRRLSRQRLLNVLLWFVTICNALLFGFHVVDPYCYYDRIPTIVIRIVWKLPYSVVAGTFCLLQMVIVKLTRLDIPSNGYHFLIGATTVYTVEIIILETLICLYEIPANYSVITDVIYIVYVVYLSSSFIYGVPTTSRYASEARRAKRELSSHSLSKLGKTFSNERQNKARINHPRIRTNLAGNRISLLIDDSSGTDTKNESSFNEKKMAIRQEKTAAFAAWHKSKFSRQRGNCNKTSYKSQSIMFGEQKMKIKTYTYSGSLDGSMTLQEYSSFTDDSGNDENPNFVFPNSSSCNHLPNIMLLGNKCSFEKGACHEQNSAEISKKLSTELSSEEEDDGNCPVLLNPSIFITNETKQFESGYIADVERMSVYSEDNESRKFKPSMWRRNTDECLEEAKLPNSPSFLSFQRLRQGHMLHALIRYAYLVTICIMLSCISSVYTVLNLTCKQIRYSPAGHPVFWLVINFWQRYVHKSSSLLSQKTYQ